MKVEYNHDNGFLNQGVTLCEVFGYVEAHDNHEELLRSGWLPSQFMDDVIQNKWYQSKSLRLVCQPCISPRRKKIIEQLNYQINDPHDQLKEKRRNLFLKYYENKNFDLLDDYDTTLSFYKGLKMLDVFYMANNAHIASASFIEYDNSILFVASGYDLSNPKLSLGTNIFYILTEYAFLHNKQHLYIYWAYDLFPYKLSLPNVEYYSAGWHKINS